MYLHEAVEGFLLACMAENKAEKTVRSYKDALDRFVSDVGIVDINNIKPDHLSRFITKEKSRPGRYGAMSPSSLHKTYTVIRTFMRWAFLQGYTEKCITDYTKAPRLPKALPDVMTDEEVVRLMKYLNLRESFRDFVIFQFFLDTGARLDEVCSLNLSDINLHSGTAVIQHGKGDKERVVPLGRVLRNNLHKYIFRERRAEMGEEAVFVNCHGERLGREGLSTLVRRILAAIHVEGKGGAHKLRHTFATNYLRNGGNIEGLRKILGHENIAITQIYLHLLTEDIINDHKEASPIDRFRSKF